MITIAILTLVAVDVSIALAAGTLGFFIGKRGLVGTKSDLNDIRNDLAKLKTAIVNAVKK